MKDKALKKIPKFKSNEDAGKFWLEHDTSQYFDLNKAERAYPPVAKRTSTREKNLVDIPLPESLVKLVRARAKREDVPVEVLMKRYVEEGLMRKKGQRIGS